MQAMDKQAYETFRDTMRRIPFTDAGFLKAEIPSNLQPDQSVCKPLLSAADVAVGKTPSCNSAGGKVAGSTEFDVCR